MIQRHPFSDGAPSGFFIDERYVKAVRVFHDVATRGVFRPTKAVGIRPFAMAGNRTARLRERRAALSLGAGAA